MRLYVSSYSRIFPFSGKIGICLLMLLVAGCSKTPVSGIVQLPEGSSLKPGDLRVVTCIGEAPVQDDGSFRAFESGSSPAIAFAADANGKPVLIGFVNGQTTSTLNARSTAVALLFQGLAAFTLPRDAWPQALEFLDGDSNTETLAAAVARRLSASPYAIPDNDTELLTALNAAVTAILESSASSLSAAKRIGNRVQSFDVSVSASAETPAMVIVEPSDEISGVRVGPNAAGNGITITNNFRRHLWAYVYRTGWQSKDDDADAEPRAITPWERIVPGTSVSGYMPAVNGFQGTIGTILDAVSGQVAYSPVTSEAIVLSLSPAEASRTYYKMFVVGPSWKPGDFDDELPAGYAGMAEAGEWKSAEKKMDLLTVFQEFLFPAVLSVFPAEALGKNLNSEQMGLVIEDLMKIITNSYPQFAEQLAVHDYTGAMVTFFKAFDSSLIRSSVVEALIRSGLVKGGITMSAAACLDDLNIYVSAIDKFLSAGDLGIVTAQLASCCRFMEWSATTTKPFIRIQNNPSTVTAGLDVELTCYGTAGIEGTIEYHWSTSGAHGHLEDSHGNAGTDFTSSDQIVLYVADEDAEDGAQDTVAVTAYLKENSEKTELGSATATVFIVESQSDVAITPASPSVSPGGTQRLDVSILPSLPMGTEVEYDWAATSTAGTLRGPKDEKAPFTGAYATYSAGESSGTDTVTVNVWRITGDDQRLPVGSATATVRVTATRTAIYSIEPHLDSETGSSIFSHGTFLIFPTIPGARKYNVTWHDNGVEIPEEWKYDTYWMYPRRYVYGDASTTQYCSYDNPCYTTPESMEPLGVAEDPSAAIQEGEVAVPMYYYGQRGGDLEGMISRMNETRKYEIGRAHV